MVGEEVSDNNFQTTSKPGRSPNQPAFPLSSLSDVIITVIAPIASLVFPVSRKPTATWGVTAYGLTII